MNLAQIKKYVVENPMIAYPAVGAAVLLVWSLLLTLVSKGGEPRNEKASAGAANPIGISVGGADQQAYMARLEKNYYDFEDRVKAIERQVKGMNSMVKEFKKSQKDALKAIARVNDKLAASREENGPVVEGSTPLVELSVADVAPVAKDNGSVYLPIGSFCKGTLLTGVYAAADVNNPLPVLIALKEAFYGPNASRIPLAGALMLGKAYGDLVSGRAYIQIVALSSVLPDGQAFEREENLGYITDQYGELGVSGQVVRNTGRQLALSFMGGFMSGGAQALADEEVSSSNNAYGTVSRQVTGSSAKNAVFSGLAKSAGRMSEYYAKQAEDMVPAVHVRNGAVVYFIVQKGVRIDGLPRDQAAALAAID